ncbi:hypothetical protein [Paracoccus sp. KR1-242]|uniref:hypothetical protein n=1 Tax=Paracoccus sp. KR1-242 TaxID=3410028 RepID=UPI003C0A4B41
MARHIELLGISHDILSVFISRNNDLHGYWALGQLRNTMECRRADRMVMALTGENHVQQDPECLGLSERYSTMLRKHVSSRQLKQDWVQHARLTVEMVASGQMQCSLQVVTDLGRSFNQCRDVVVLRHDPNREFKRAE